MKAPKAMVKLLSVGLTLAFITSCALPRAFPSAEQQVRSWSLVERGIELLQQGSWDRSEAAFQVAFDLSPSAASLDGLGCIAMRRGHAAEAEHYFLSALEYDPEYARAMANLALLYEQEGLLAQAERFYRNSIEQDPADAHVRNNFASFLAGHRYTLAGQREARSELARAEILTAEPRIVKNMRRMKAP